MTSTCREWTHLVAASTAHPVPVAPPPMMSTSYGLDFVPCFRDASCSAREGTFPFSSRRRACNNQQVTQKADLDTSLKCPRSEDQATCARRTKTLFFGQSTSVVQAYAYCQSESYCSESSDRLSDCSGRQSRLTHFHLSILELPMVVGALPTGTARRCVAQGGRPFACLEETLTLSTFNGMAPCPDT